MEYEEKLALIKDGNKEHINLLKRGAEFWNQWRAEHDTMVPNLNWANLSRTDLRHFDLSRTSLSKADLHYADLTGANLSEANLIKADLSGANLSGANLSGTVLRRTDLSGANLTGTNFSGTDFRQANIRHAKLRGANLSRWNLSKAVLSGVDLSEANLSGADLSWTDLSEANLSGTNLSGANLSGADLSRAVLHMVDLSGAILSGLHFNTPRPMVRQESYEIDDQKIPAMVLFTAYYPRAAQADTRYSFLLYAHTEEAFEKVADDVEKFTDELGDIAPPPKTAKQTTQIRPNAPITVVPECEQIEFDPPSLTKKWDGEWTRFGFDFKPTQTMSGDTLFIRVSIQVATAEVAHINCAVEVVDQKADTNQHIAIAENPLAKAKLISSTSALYQTIFISYSRKDKEVIKVYKLVQDAVGNVTFMDTYSIRAGEDWRSALSFAIDQADIFQLFWSENSAQSENVHNEWEYALKHKCPETRCVGFIRPVCWNDPLNPLPPEELGHLNFKYVPLDDLVTS